MLHCDEYLDLTFQAVLVAIRNGLYLTLREELCDQLIHRTMAIRIAISSPCLSPLASVAQLASGLRPFVFHLGACAICS